jgi:uncharacterized protein (DUF58 family)
MRLSRRGVLVLATAPVFAVLAWVFGLPEAAVLAVCVVLAVAGAAGWVATHRPQLDIRRSAHPARCSVGDVCQIRLRTHNHGTRRSPVVVLEDDVGRHGSARLHLGPLDPDASATASYSLPTDRRGMHRVGPLTSVVTDPFLLARAEHTDQSHVTVIVLPRTWPLAPLPAAPGDEPEQGVRALTSLSTVDEEFSALRSYVPGDDIRRIHWPTTARTGSPVMRQFDLPWQHRTTVVLDARGSSHTGASFERAVSVAASLVQLAATRGELVRLVTTAPGAAGRRSRADSELRFVSAREHLDALMDRLAAVVLHDAPDGPDPRDEPDLVATARRIAPTASGRLVVCTGAAGGSELAELELGTARYGLRVLAVTAAGDAATGTVATPNAMTTVRWDGRSALDDVWREQTAAVRTSVGAPRATGAAR